ncbi:MAG TPA: type II toxin-antitoxin system VapB family antitoxin [Caulobacteraceae bacterium]|nr:type II toxin-antitoxin system VapB family antitoxin [Caulobacteraceae bacterium]
MALSFKDKETDALARQVASLTGETLTEAVRVSLAERLERERSKKGKPQDFKAAVNEIVRRVAELPVLDDRTDDEILGYDGDGLPS